MILTIRNDGKLPGQFLMDRDLLELEACGRGEFGPNLSLYEWDVPTLSLGFHQDSKKIDLQRLDDAGVPLVRRPTGGAAVLHSEELTYSIVVPHVEELRSGALLLEYVGRSITSGLRAIGVNAVLDERGEAMSPLQNRTSCFVRTSRWEITVDGKKIVGSAQRRLGTALLQHGSILLGEDHLRIAEFLSLPKEEERGLLRGKLAEKSTCVTNAIGAGDHRESLRNALCESFQNAFSEFVSQIEFMRKPVSI